MIKGCAVIISDERIYKIANREVKRTRHKRKKAAEKREEDIAKGLIDPNEKVDDGKKGDKGKEEPGGDGDKNEPSKDPEDCFQTDFPFDKI